MRNRRTQELTNDSRFLLQHLNLTGMIGVVLDDSLKQRIVGAVAFAKFFGREGEGGFFEGLLGVVEGG